MKNFKILAALLTILICVGLSGCGDTSSSEEIRFGTGDAGGKYFAYGTKLSEVAAADKIIFDVKNTMGSAANLRLLREGFLDMAIVQSDTLAHAVKGTGVFVTVGEGTGYAAVAGVYTEACQIVVAENSNIKNVFDLAGKKVSVGEKESGVLQNAEQILLAHGLTFKMLEPSNLSFTDSAAALERGEIDAFFCTAGTPTKAIVELNKNKKIRLLSISPEVLSNMMKMYSGYSACVIPAGTYDGQTENISTLGVKAVILASTNLKDNDVEKITEIIFDNAGKISSAIEVQTDFNIDYAVKNIPSAFHAGAAKFYKSKGVDVEIYSGESTKSVKAGQD